MRFWVFVVALLVTLASQAQRRDSSFAFGFYDEMKMSYEEFKKYNLSEVEVYAYNLKRNGKVKDSLCVLRQKLDKDSNKIEGIIARPGFIIHGPSFLTWDDFVETYNDEGLLVENSLKPIRVLQQDENPVSYIIYTSLTTFYYDSGANLLQEKYQHISDHYSIHKAQYDAFRYRKLLIKKITDYSYDSLRRKIKRYQTEDSISFLDSEWEYGDNGLVRIWTWYTDDGPVHSKKYYYYDGLNRLVRLVDSTGWYLTGKKPFINSTTEYEYSEFDSTLSRKIFENESGKWTTVFNPLGDIIDECRDIGDGERCTSFRYTRNEMSQIVMKETTAPTGWGLVTYDYNPTGLPTRIQTLREDKSVQILKCFYR